jgi:hypothetical protein
MMWGRGRDYPTMEVGDVPLEVMALNTVATLLAANSL